MKGILNRRRPWAGIFAIGGMMILPAWSSEATTWHFDTVDATGVGRFTSLQMDKFGDAHVAYVSEDGNYSLKYGFWDHSLKKWFTMPVDQKAQFCSLALDSKQHPHISYVEYGSSRGAKLRYAHWDGASWKKQAIPVNSGGVAYYTSITVDNKDNPTITFYDHLDQDNDFVLWLRVVSWNGSYWESRTIDQTRGSGKFNSVASDSAGNLHVAYANVSAMTASLRYAFWNGKSWNVEVLEGITEPYTVFSVSMVLDQVDVPHITYTDVVNRRVKYATRRGGKWQFEVVDTLTRVSYPDRNGIAVDPQGRAYLTYYDPGQGALKLAYRRDQRWIAEVIDQSVAGFTSSLQINHAAIWVTYSDEGSGALKCAHGSLAQLASVSQERPLVARR